RAVTISTIVDCHRHKAALSKARGILLDSHCLSVDAVANYDGGPLASGCETLWEEDSSVTRRAIRIEGDLSRCNTVSQIEDPVLGLGAALAFHRWIGRLFLKIVSMLFNDIGTYLSRNGNSTDDHSQSNSDNKPVDL